MNIPGKTVKQVTKLDLSGKGLKSIPNDVFQFTNLTKLILHDNEISSIPKDILKLKHLKVLDISNNNLRQLHAPIFHLPKLKTLDIRHNHIRKLPIQIKNSSIEELIADYNEITEIDLTNLCNLKKLVISNNQLSNFEVKQPFTKLRYLWIGNNPIQTFSVSKSKLPNIKQLYTYTTEAQISSIKEKYASLFCRRNNVVSFLEDEAVEPLKTDNSVDNKGKKDMNIFISYAHADSTWLELLQKHLKVLKRYYQEIDVWDDNKLRTGDHWKEEIEKALNKANIAILLVSTDFLASDFITNNELPPLLANAEKKGTKIFPLIISPCMFSDSEISVFQAVNSPDKTLEDCNKTERERTLLNLMNDIKSHL